MMNSLVSAKALQKSEFKVPDSPVMYAYVSLLVGMYAVYDAADGFLSVFLTFSVMFECLALCLIGMQSCSSQSASGISAKALGLEALSLTGRLSSTFLMGGYVPADVTGDFLYYFVDACSLAIALWLLHRVLVVHSETYEATAEMTFVYPLVIVSFALAMVLHADLNAHPLTDIVWMASLFTGVAAVVPQLWLVMRARGSVDAFTGNYVVAMGLSRACCLIFIWVAGDSFTSTPLIMEFNHAPVVVMTACMLNLALLGVCTFYYMRAVAKDGLLACLLNLPVLV